MITRHFPEQIITEIIMKSVISCLALLVVSAYAVDLDHEKVIKMISE